MAKDKKEKAGRPDRVAAQNMHKTFLEALRHREQEILRFMAILAPALGGFVWLVNLDDEQARNLYVFGVGTIGVLFLLVVGAVYSLALGYNYRCITLQVAKLECTCLGLRRVILNKWPRKRDDFIAGLKVLFKRRYCEPPEIIKVFWYTFNLGIAGVALAAVVRILGAKWRDVAGLLWALAIIVAAVVCGVVSFKVAVWYGTKFKKVCDEEPPEWEPFEMQTEE